MDIKEVFMIVGVHNDHRIAVECSYAVYQRLYGLTGIESESTCSVDFEQNLVLFVRSLIVDKVLPGNLPHMVID